MLTATKTYKDNSCTGIWIFDGETTSLLNTGDKIPPSEQSIYIPFGIALAIADAIMFDDNDDGPYKLIGYIEVYFDYNNDIVLSDGIEHVRIEKHEIIKFRNELWSMI